MSRLPSLRIVTRSHLLFEDNFILTVTIQVADGRITHLEKTNMPSLFVQSLILLTLLLLSLFSLYLFSIPAVSHLLLSGLEFR